jgi:hypothetical protein
MFSTNLSSRGILKLTRPLLAALAALLIGAAALYLPLSRAQAQGVITVHKTLANHGPVVRVGERLTFTIHITNDSVFTLTTLPLSDTYRADILALASSDLNGAPLPSDSQAANGNFITLFWDDLTDMPPGQAITVTMVFTAEHPGTAVVNAAEVHDAEDNAGHTGLRGNSQEQNDAIGGAAPLDKRLMPITSTPFIGMLIGFTITITNDGAAHLTQLPLRDIYDPAALHFSYAIPPPDEVNAAAGELRWYDLTTYFGDLPGDAVIHVPVYFTVTQAIQTAFNRAEVEAVIDEYSNTLAAGADEVPITVIIDELQRLIDQKKEEKEEEHHDEGPDIAATAAAQANAQATAEAAITATPTPQGPIYLPETGHNSDLMILLAAGLGVLSVGWGVRAISRRDGSS